MTSRFHVIATFQRRLTPIHTHPLRGTWREVRLSVTIVGRRVWFCYPQLPWFARAGPDWRREWYYLLGQVFTNIQDPGLSSHITKIIWTHCINDIVVFTFIHVHCHLHIMFTMLLLYNKIWPKIIHCSSVFILVPHWYTSIIYAPSRSQEGTIHHKMGLSTRTSIVVTKV